MTADIAYLLCWLVGPRLLVVVDASHVHLIMGYTANYSELQTLLLALYSGKECSLSVIGERTTKSIAHVVAERSDAVKLVGRSLHSKLLLRIGTRSGAPSLTIYIYCGVDCIDSSTYLVHRFDVVNAHKVESESVNVKFVNPVLHALDHKLAHQRTLRCRLVATTRTV